MTSSKATKLQTPGVEGGQNELFNYFVDGVKELVTLDLFSQTMSKILLGSAVISLLPLKLNV